MGRKKAQQGLSFWEIPICIFEYRMKNGGKRSAETVYKTYITLNKTASVYISIFQRKIYELMKIVANNYVMLTKQVLTE